MAKDPATTSVHEEGMHRLMQSEKHTLEHRVSGPMSSHLHIQLNQFLQPSAALDTCDTANEKAAPCHCVLNETGEEYYQGA
jgi:hypothetical protein